MYLDWCQPGPNPVRQPMTHLQFKNALYEALLGGWMWQNEVINAPLNHHPTIHMPSQSTKKRLYVVCRSRKLHTYCYKCGSKFMCWKEGCYQVFHKALMYHRYDVHYLSFILIFVVLVSAFLGGFRAHNHFIIIWDITYLLRFISVTNYPNSFLVSFLGNPCK
jgi:hypothetical protein